MNCGQQHLETVLTIHREAASSAHGLPLWEARATRATTASSTACEARETSGPPPRRNDITPLCGDTKVPCRRETAGVATLLFRYIFYGFF